MRQSAVRSYSKEEWELAMRRVAVIATVPKVSPILMKMSFAPQIWIFRLHPLSSQSQRCYRNRSIVLEKRQNKKRKIIWRWWISMISYHRSMRFYIRSMIRFQIAILKQRKSCRNWSRKIRNWLKSWRRRNRKLLKLKDTKMIFMKRWKRKKKK